MRSFPRVNDEDGALRPAKVVDESADRNMTPPAGQNSARWDATLPAASSGGHLTVVITAVS